MMEDWTLQSARDHGIPLSKRPASLQREAGLVETGSHFLWRSALRLYMHLYHRLRLIHVERIPVDPPFVIIANHASHLDALALSAALPLRLCDRVFPVAAGDVFFQTPTVAWFAAGLVNALPMWRKHCGAHAMITLRSKLVEQSCGYILFPEGGRSRDGRMQRFKSGLGMLVAGTDVPVIPCHLTETFDALPAGRFIPRPSRVTIAFGRPLRFREVANDRDGWALIAARAEAVVRALGIAPT